MSTVKKADFSNVQGRVSSTEDIRKQADSLNPGRRTFACFNIEADHKRTGNESGRVRIGFNTAEHAAATAATGSDKRGSQ